MATIDFFDYGRVDLSFLLKDYIKLYFHLLLGEDHIVNSVASRIRYNQRWEPRDAVAKADFDGQRWLALILMHYCLKIKNLNPQFSLNDQKKLNITFNDKNNGR